MAEITAQAVNTLRQMTNAGLMACKKALVETDGNLDAAVDLLRKKGIASATKKAGREVKDGAIFQAISAGSKSGILVEINCETDFVARNDMFKAFGDEIAKKLLANPSADVDADRVAAVAKIGENIQVRRSHKLDVSGNGLVAAYIHAGAKIGVLVEVGAGKEATTATEDFKQLVRDITLHIAAASPVAVRREDVAADVVAKEREIHAQSDALKGKPAAAMENILKGKLNKFFETNCLNEQGFVKNPELKVEAHVASVAKKVDDEITIRRFLRFQLGEAV